MGFSISSMSTIHSEEYQAMIKKLIKARKEAGFTQVEVAKKLGVHQSFISKIETCQRRVDVLELGRLLELYGFDIKTILS